MIEDRVPGFATLAVHAGAPASVRHDADLPPLAPAPQANGADPAANLFALRARLSGPADAAVLSLEERVAALEGGTAAFAVATGQAALFLLFRAQLGPGDELVASPRIGAATVAQFAGSLERDRRIVRWADPDAPGALEAAISPRTKAIFVESITDLGAAVSDLEAIAAIARRAQVPLIVDNTLATPCLCRPLEHGADIVIHSAARLLSGQDDAPAAFIVDGGSFDWAREARYPELSEPQPDLDGTVIGEAFGNFALAVACRHLAARDLGTLLAPSDAARVLAGVETLPLRLRRQSDTALAVAERLSADRRVNWVSYPGLPGNRYHGLARKYCPSGAGPSLAMGLAGSGDAAERFLGQTRLFLGRAEIGGTRSVAVRADATRGANARAPAPGEIRLSIGLEDAADLLADLDQALGG